MSATLTLVLPSGECDCHVHFYGDPPEYHVLMQRLGLERVVAVSASDARGRPAEHAGDSRPR
jgi:hypothetical protein